MAELPDANKTPVSLLVAGHVDCGKSTVSGRLMFELGRISERELEKLRTEAIELGKESFMFAFYLDKVGAHFLGEILSIFSADSSYTNAL